MFEYRPWRLAAAALALLWAACGAAPREGALEIVFVRGAPVRVRDATGATIDSRRADFGLPPSVDTRVLDLRSGELRIVRTANTGWYGGAATRTSCRDDGIVVRTVDATVGGTPAILALDTMSPITILYTGLVRSDPDDRRRLSDHDRTRVALAGDVTIGIGRGRVTTTVAVAPRPGVTPRCPTRTDGTLGLDVLSHCAWVVNGADGAGTLHCDAGTVPSPAVERLPRESPALLVASRITAPDGSWEETRVDSAGDATVESSSPTGAPTSVHVRLGPFAVDRVWARVIAYETWTREPRRTPPTPARTVWVPPRAPDVYASADPPEVEGIAEALESVARARSRARCVEPPPASAAAGGTLELSVDSEGAYSLAVRGPDGVERAVSTCPVWDARWLATGWNVGAGRYVLVARPVDAGSGYEQAFSIDGSEALVSAFLYDATRGQEQGAPPGFRVARARTAPGARLEPADPKRGTFLLHNASDTALAFYSSTADVLGSVERWNSAGYWEQPARSLDSVASAGCGFGFREQAVAPGGSAIARPYWPYPLAPGHYRFVAPFENATDDPDAETVVAITTFDVP